MIDMSLPASTNILLTMDHSEESIMSAMASNGRFLRDCLEFLFRDDVRMQTLFILTGKVGTFLAGAAAHGGINGVIVEDCLTGNIDAEFKKVVVIVGVMTDDVNPVDIWRKVRDETFPRKQRGLTIEIRCLFDDRDLMTAPSISSIENVEVVAVKSLANIAPGATR